MKKGKLVIIDGIDGSGKATQVKLLRERLNQEGLKIKTIDFPQYENNFFGQLIGEFLRGQYGDFAKTDPRLASIIYAGDRFESSKQIKNWLDNGFVVVADRYVSSNQIHQAGKISRLTDRKKFLNWLDQLEYEVFKITKPDLVIYLDVPVAVSQDWLSRVNKNKKKYLSGKKDVVESNLKYLANSRNSALNLAKQNKDWEIIKCCFGKTCLNQAEVQEQVFKIIKQRLLKKT